MRNAVWMLLAGLILPCVGCAGNSGLSGKWLGSITEKGKSTQVLLDLRTQGDAIEGKLTILDGAGDAKTGTSYQIVNAIRSDNKFQFIVPISGQIDADAVFFELLVKQGRLEGSGREMRKGSPDLLAVFVKQK